MTFYSWDQLTHAVGQKMAVPDSAGIAFFILLLKSTSKIRITSWVQCVFIRIAWSIIYSTFYKHRRLWVHVLSVSMLPPFAILNSLRHHWSTELFTHLRVFIRILFIGISLNFLIFKNLCHIAPNCYWLFVLLIICDWNQCAVFSVLITA